MSRPPLEGTSVSTDPHVTGGHELHEHTPGGPTPDGHGPRVVPVGTLMLVAVVLLSIIWLWMLVLGIQQGRA